MTEYIEKGKLLDYVQDTYGGGNEDNTCIWYGDVIEMIRSEPAAEVAPVVRGKWIHNDEWWEFICIHCHKAIGDTKKYQYCPHCGAKMDLED